VAAENILGIVPAGTHTWKKFINEDELREHIEGLCDEMGEKWTCDVKSNGILYDPTVGEWRLKDTIGGPIFNYFLAARRAPSIE